MVLARSAFRGDPSCGVNAAFAADVMSGLTANPKRISPKHFYDAAGSQLFEQITQLPEYYPTRTELQILQINAGAIRALLEPGSALIEFGSGSTAKARILLATGRFEAYVPIDVSAEFLKQEAARLKADLPQLTVLPVVADFTLGFELPAELPARPAVGFFPGSTIGNFEPYQASAFLQQVATALGPGATLIVGVDLIKDPEILFAAYNDRQSITAKFNRNILVRINRELGANFDINAFEHHAFYNRELRRVEMHLASMQRQKVRIGSRTIEFRAGETIHTENSYKYTLGSFAALARGAGWMPRASFTDPAQYFSVHVLVPEHPRGLPRYGSRA
jgi:dimethylhistidine N-methyltransferase